MKYWDSRDQRNLSTKFGHSEKTQSKSYGYLEHNSLCVEAVEAMNKAGKRRKKESLIHIGNSTGKYVKIDDKL